MSMTVYQLIQQLQQMNPDAEVRLASQPHWPFENEIDEIVEVDAPKIMDRETFDSLSEEEQEDAEQAADEGRLLFIEEGQELPEPIVYIGEGRQIGYLPQAASRELGWK